MLLMTTTTTTKATGAAAASAATTSTTWYRHVNNGGRSQYVAMNAKSNQSRTDIMQYVLLQHRLLLSVTVTNGQEMRV